MDRNMDFDDDGVMKMLTELWIFEGNPWILDGGMAGRNAGAIIWCLDALKI